MIVIARLDKQKHKLILLQILLEISNNKILKKSLVFKGGTALFLLYNLNRFSTDLDFDYIIDSGYTEIEILNELEKILIKYGDLKDKFNKQNTIFCLLSYGDIDHNVKVEISKRGVSGKYDIKTFFGIQLYVLDIEYLTANKFLALLNRPQLANRDIFDIHFIIKNNLGINKEFIKEKTDKNFEDYILDCIDFLQKLPEKYNILDGLGVTVDEKEKNNIKKNLVKETILFLYSYL